MDDFERELGGDLLASVARSFYLSLKFLPKRVRGAASLGYLLARATDTVADTDSVPAGERLRLLGDMGAAVAGEGDPGAVARELRELVPDGGDAEGEALLLAKFGRCLDWLATVPDWQRDAVRRVLAPITKGQSDDLRRFGGEGVAVLGTDGELEQYTYDVAGCVGVFWTDLGFGAFGSKFALLSRAEMEELGTRYGEGLQLLNILRDFPEDLAAGRCYFPGADPEAGGEAIWRGEAARWRARCREWLAASKEYLDAVRVRRMRLPTALPALIGAKTLARLEAASWEELEAGVKVPRSEVKKLLAKAALANLRRRGLGKMFERLASGA